MTATPTEWHPSEVFGPPFSERKDTDLGVTVVMLRMTSQCAVSDNDLAIPEAVDYIRARMLHDLDAEYQRIKRDDRTDAELNERGIYDLIEHVICGSMSHRRAAQVIAARLAESRADTEYAEEARRLSILHHEETIAELAESRAEVARLVEPFRNAQETVDELMRLRVEVAALRALMQEAADDFDGKSVLFSSRFRAALTPKEADDE